MDKFAQKRSLRSKLWENVNLTGMALEGLHSELAEVMNEMRDVDESIRNIAEDVKPWIRHAKSSARQRDYLNAALSVAEFHKRIRHVAYILGKFTKSVNIKHHKYLLDNFDGANREHLFSYDPNAEIKEACEAFDTLIKEAGAYDWAKDKFLNYYDIVTDTGSNIITNKGRARKLLEKRFSASFIKQLKDKTIKLVAESEKMLRKLLSTFDMLEAGISRRNVGLYVAKSEDFIKDFNSYHKVYVEYNEKILGPLREYQANLDKEESEKNEKIVQQKIEQENREVEEAKRSPLVSPFVETKEYEEPSFNEWKAKHKQPTKEEKTNILNQLDQNERDESLIPVMVDEEEKLGPKSPLKLQVPEEKGEQEEQKAAHRNFIDQLEVYANEEDMNSFVHGLLDYSEQLEESNPTASKDLLTIAKNVISDYKTAGIFDKFFGKDKEDGAPANNSPIQQEFQRANGPKREKPQDLIEEERGRYKPKKIDLPDGKIDQAYSDISFLSSITPDKIRITHDTANYLKNVFSSRIINVLKLDDFDPYIESFSKNLVPAIKNAVYNGWVLAAASVQDEFNPRDKYIEIYTRLNLSDIDSSLKGVAKLTVSARISANTGTLTVRNVKKHFAIDGIKSSQPSPAPSSSSAPPTPKPVKLKEEEEAPPITRRSPDSGSEDIDVDMGDADHEDYQYYDE